MRNIRQASFKICLLLLLGTVFLTSCTSKNSSSEPDSDSLGEGPAQGTELVSLNSDGVGGMTAYELIRNAFGPNAIESPDLYQINHPAGIHIWEEHDAIVGDHFVFAIHRDLDRDRDTEATDRQRNEIKIYDGSAANLKAKEGDTFIYEWKFKINESMAVSKNFTHLFQLKAVGGDDSHPMVTITGRKKGENDLIEVRYSPSTTDEFMSEHSWVDVRGYWLSAYCEATFSDVGKGKLRLIVRKPDGSPVLEVEREGLDMWRQGSDFVRPKWGIYRSLSDKANLRPGEETVGFANFKISKVQ